jgi:hypothetical protein
MPIEQLLSPLASDPHKVWNYSPIHFGTTKYSLSCWLGQLGLERLCFFVRGLIDLSSDMHPQPERSFTASFS